VGVVLSAYRDDWPAEFERLAARLRTAVGTIALSVDHIGSTAVPGLAAKDVIDVQVIVASLDEDATRALPLLSDAGFVQRDGDWNLRDHIPANWHGDAAAWSKFVVGPRDEGERASNIHVRAAGSPNERYALLFRDYLRCDSSARRAWELFKTRLAAVTETREEYGQVKDPATDVLMASAERWAEAVGWTPRGDG
jgi:dephospho-CoA kinase